MYLLGYDIGSSSVKASLVNAETGKCIASAFYPKTEAPIIAACPGWAEQDPQMWWDNLKLATQAVLNDSGIRPEDIRAIGISYQMHGLICVDHEQRVLRPAIIWCDSRAVPYGQRAFKELGTDICLSHLLNSPGNFTASKLAWVKENEPEIYEKIYKIMLPGDYIAMRLSGEICTTVSGLSEGMFWDFKEDNIAHCAGIGAESRDSYHLPSWRPAKQCTFIECIQSRRDCIDGRHKWCGVRCERMRQL